MTIQRLIVLDDDEDYLDILSGFANVMGLNFLGHQAYSSLHTEALTQSDVVLMDVFMPEKDALDILFELSTNQTQASLAVMSGASDDVLESIKAAASQLNIKFLGTLSKPLQLKNVEDLIKGANQDTLSLPKQVDHCHDAKNEKLIELCASTEVAEWFERHFVYPVFQPQFNVETGQIVGIECLSRIRHPQQTKINPFEFISILEQQDKINAYTILFIQQALSAVKELIENSPFLACSFNISAHNLDKAFADQLVETLKASQLPPNQITLEITESIAIKMTPEALYAISRLKLFGVRLSIDDFGTGYSSISQLVDLPFNEIKIDRSFVHQLNKNQKANAIIGAAFNLASSLNFNLVIEGVETPEQLNFLRKRGACVIQGYILSEPLLEYDLKRVMEASHYLKHHYEKAFLSTL